MPVSAPDRRPLISYLRIQQDRDKRLLAILRDADARVGRELNRLRAQSGIGAEMRLEQLGRAQAAMRREMQTMWSRIGDEVNAGKAAAAAAAVEATFPGTLLKSVLPARDVDYMLRSAKETARRGIAAVEARQTLSYVPLSERVYHEANLTSGKIDEIINSALARGASAAELAKDVRAYINPNTPGGVRYAAQRLGRTELNNSFHAQAVQQGIKEPWTTTMKWNLSGSHPKPDECNEYAENESFPGGGAGIWKPEEVPSKPHPNCLCYVTPEVPDRDEFVRRYQQGEYDQYLQDEFGIGPAPVEELGWSPRVGAGPEFQAEAQEYAESALDMRTAAAKRWHEYQYAGGDWGYRTQNQILRFPEGDRRAAGLKAAWDDAFERMGMDSKEDMHLYRGLLGGRDSPDWLSDLKVGKVYTDRGVVSTTAREGVARGWLSKIQFAPHEEAISGSVVMEIRVPRGTRLLGGHKGTFETMMKPGTRFRVLKHEVRETQHFVGKTTVVVVEAIP